MLKFFRKYNKFILAVGAGLLMVVFLIQPALEGCAPSQDDWVVATIHGRELTQQDQYRAYNQLQTLGEVNPILVRDTWNEPLKWLLMVEEARDMGLSASDHEVSRALAMLGVDAPQVTAVARKLQVKEESIHETVRDWAMVQTYKSLVYGLAPAPLESRGERIMQAFQWGSGDIRATIGDPHLSAPLVEHFIHGFQSTVTIATVAVGIDQYVGQIEEPDDATISRTYEAHKDVVDGESEPYGFGYRLPDRVRIEYLSLDGGALLSRVEVTERDALEHYAANKGAFTVELETEEPEGAGDAGATTRPARPGSAAPKRLQPYDEVRDLVHLRLRREKAVALAGEAMGLARRLLLEQIDGLKAKKDDGYKVLPADFAAMPLSNVRQAVQNALKVEMSVHTDEGRWHSAADLALIEGLGSSTVGLTGRREVSVGFANYAMSVKELSPSENVSVRRLRLQVNVPSQVMTGDDTRLLFRVTAAQPSHVPDLESVRNEVIRDARMEAAFNRLVQDEATWLRRAREESLEALAGVVGSTVRTSPPFPQRVFGMGVPDITGVGRDAAFVDRVFEQAETPPAGAAAAQTAPDDAGVTGKIIVVPLPSQMKLILVRYVNFEPATRSRFEQMAGQPGLRYLVGPYLNPTSAMDDPLSIEALKARLDYRTPNDAAADDAPDDTRGNAAEES